MTRNEQLAMRYLERIAETLEKIAKILEYSSVSGKVIDRK